MVELEDRVLERALAGEETRVSRAELERLYSVPREVLDRLAELEVLTPNSRGYSPFRRSDRRGHSALSAPAATTRRSASPSTTRWRYKRAPLEELVKEEVEVLMERLAGQMATDRALEVHRFGARRPLEDLIGALHSKLLVAELRAATAARARSCPRGRASSGQVLLRALSHIDRALESGQIALHHQPVRSRCTAKPQPVRHGQAGVNIGSLMI